MNVISIFDESGNMLRPMAEAGAHVFCIDILNDNRVDYVGKGSITFVKESVLSEGFIQRCLNMRPRFVSAFPPCTDLAVSGSRHFQAKAAANPAYQSEAMALVAIGREVIRQSGAPGFFENPVSVISSLYRKPDYIFDPCDFGGYLPEDDTHPRWPEYIMPRDAYTKRTCLWAYNGFKLPPKKRVEPVVAEDNAGNRSSVQWKKLGGKSAKTKQIRSETPRGFARAVFEQFEQSL